MLRQELIHLKIKRIRNALLLTENLKSLETFKHDSVLRFKFVLTFKDSLDPVSIFVNSFTRCQYDETKDICWHKYEGVN